jgi:hypothetical protein
MNILVACEFSGIVREAFRAKGHKAYSCDLEPALDNSQHHFRMDIFMAMRLNSWDIMIAHPPCTYLAVSGARWFKERQEEQAHAIHFFLTLMNCAIPRIAIENPIGIMSTRYRKPDQIIHPWQFGHGETKATCLWLKDLPLLTPTNIVAGREPRIHKMPPSKDRSKLRSITYQGIADAMAEQWTL